MDLHFGATIDGNDPALIDCVIPEVDFVEITPDRWASYSSDTPPALKPDSLAVLSSLARQRKLLVHGVGLSIASHDGWNADYVGLLDQLVAGNLPIQWHSEHLSFSAVDGEELGTMVEPPCTAEALELIASRIRALQNRYGIPFLIEHVARAFARGSYDEIAPAEFLNRLLHETGCGLLLDVYNLECDHYNFGLDPFAVLDGIDLNTVREIHIAGGTIKDDFKLDIHSRFVADSTIKLLKQVLIRCPNAEVVVFELLQESVPALGYDSIRRELVRLKTSIHA